jgi:hypothetical protein
MNLRAEVQQGYGLGFRLRARFRGTTARQVPALLHTGGNLIQVSCPISGRRARFDRASVDV